MSRWLERPLLIGLMALAALATVRLAGCSGAPAPKPAMFSDALTLEDALERSAETGKPVFVVATADWCGPCQVYKRGALADEAVALLIGERTIPVYLDVDANPEAAEMLGISSIPASFLIRDNEVRARFGGVKSADALTQWIQANAGV